MPGDDPQTGWQKVSAAHAARERAQTQRRQQAEEQAEQEAERALQAKQDTELEDRYAPQLDAMPDDERRALFVELGDIPLKSFIRDSAGAHKRPMYRLPLLRLLRDRDSSRGEEESDAD